jgi:integrase
MVRPPTPFRVTHPDEISKRFAVAVAAVDVPRITLHRLRHTWASLRFKRE